MGGILARSASRPRDGLVNLLCPRLRAFALRARTRYDLAVSLLQIAALAVVQGMAELLPVSSSAHVVVAEKLMGLDPSSPEMTFLLVMLHTGTTFAVIVYFWNAWREHYFSSVTGFRIVAVNVVIAT